MKCKLDHVSNLKHTDIKCLRPKTGCDHVLVYYSNYKGMLNDSVVVESSLYVPTQTAKIELPSLRNQKVATGHISF